MPRGFLFIDSVFKGMKTSRDDTEIHDFLNPSPTTFEGDKLEEEERKKGRIQKRRRRRGGGRQERGNSTSNESSAWSRANGLV